MSGIWFTSCKTSRNIETQKQIDYSGDFLYLRNLIESLRLDVNKQTKITTDKLSDLKIENKTVYLSLPDSTGKQYPVKESTTTASKQEQERTEIYETLSITLQQFSNRLDTINNKMNALMNQKEKVIEEVKAFHQYGFHMYELLGFYAGHWRRFGRVRLRVADSTLSFPRRHSCPHNRQSLFAHQSA